MLCHIGRCDATLPVEFKFVLVQIPEDVAYVLEKFSSFPILERPLKCQMVMDCNERMYSSPIRVKMKVSVRKMTLPV